MSSNQRLPRPGSVRLGGVHRLNDQEARDYDRDNLLFHAVRDRRFGRATCFLCGRRLGTRNRSDEHVIPRWVQDRFQLWNAQLTLLNGTAIPYRQLTIPCCRPCNNDHLSRVESRVRTAVMGGFETASQLDQTTLFLWLGKIFYGLLLREYFLPRDRRRRARGRIVPRGLLKQYDLHHTMLQAARLPMTFQPSVPASIFVFPLQAPTELAAQFDFRDSTQALTMSMRLGNVGVIGALQDGGAQRTGFASHIARYQQHPLHPLQFEELTAKFFYKSSLLTRTPRFLLHGNYEEVTVTQLPLAGISSRPIFDEWDQESYAHALSAFAGVPLEMIYEPPDRVMTWLDSPDGRVQEFSLSEQPWPLERD